VRFPTGDEALDDVINNTRLAEQYELLAKELDVLEPKTAEDVYKTQTESRTPRTGRLRGKGREHVHTALTVRPGRGCPLRCRGCGGGIAGAAMFGAAQADSARANLAVSIVNGFVNAGFRKDKLLTLEDGQAWIFKHKEHGARPSHAHTIQAQAQAQTWP
jgi:26S proteasome regulatory subunit N1